MPDRPERLERPDMPDMPDKPERPERARDRESENMRVREYETPSTASSQSLDHLSYALMI